MSFRALIPAKIGFREKELSKEVRINFFIVALGVKEIRTTGDVFQSNLLSLLRELNEKYRRFVVVIDEAQVLAFLRGVSARGLLQLIHNNYDKISVVLTGSMPGLLEKIITPSRASAPGFARYVERIEIPRWNEEESVDFLRKGLEEAGVKGGEELREAYEELSGVPGFLTHYGLLRTNGKQHSKALKETVDYAVSQWKRDVETFVEIYNSPMYVKVLRALAKTVAGATWSEIKGELEMRERTPVTKSVLSKTLQNLLAAGMLDKPDERYVIGDRALKKAVALLR